MLAIYKRELHSYFTTATGFLFMAFILFFVGIYFTALNLVQGYASFSYAIFNISFVFLIATPMLSMRSLAEERKNRTDQLLLTSPVSVTKMVMGKYLAMITLLAMTCLVCAAFPVILSFYGASSFAVDYATLLAFFLSGCAYIAIGLYISSLTESPVIACVGTFAVLLILYLISSLSSMIPIEALANLLASLSLHEKLKNFVYELFDVKALIYFISVAAFFVFLSIQSVNRRRWN